MNDLLYTRHAASVEKYFRNRLGEGDLADPSLLTECRTELYELTQKQTLGSIYPCHWQ